MKLATFLLISSLIFSANTSAKTAIKTDPVDSVMTLLAALNSSHYQNKIDYVSEHISPNAIKRIGGIDSYARYLSAEHKFHQHLDFVAIETVNNRDSATHIEAYVMSKNTQLRYRLSVSLDHKAEDKLYRIRLYPDVQQQTSPLDQQQAIAEIDNYLTDLTTSETFSGSVIIAKDSKVLMQRSYGQANKQFEVANTNKTMFNLGSMNKMFTSLSILKLVEQNKLALDTPLPMALGLTEEVPGLQQIQIQHLLSHTSGLGRFKCEQGEYWAAKSIASCKAKLVQSTPLFQAGSRYRYSNEGMFVLGLIIENITAKPYQEVVSDFILQPAKMTETSCLNWAFADRPAALGYSFDGQRNKWRNNLFIHDKRCSPAGGYYASAGDLLKFSQALLAGEIVNKTLTELALTSKPELNSSRYGYGFAVWTQKDKRVVGHNGAFPGVSAQIDMHLDTGYTLVVLSNHSFAADPVLEKINLVLGI